MTLADDNPLFSCLKVETTPTEVNAWRKRMLRIYDESSMAALKRAEQTFRLATVTLALSRCRTHADALKTPESVGLFDAYGQYLDGLIRRDRSNASE